MQTDNVDGPTGVPVFRVPVRDSYIYSKSSLKLPDLILIKYDCLRLRNKQRDGGKLDRDIWSSRNAQFYHGCSVASSKFASVYLFQCCLFVPYDLI